MAKGTEHLLLTHVKLNKILLEEVNTMFLNLLKEENKFLFLKE